MMNGAHKIVNNCAAVKKGENILIIAEHITYSIANALALAVVAKEAEPSICIIEPRSADGQEPPRGVAKQMEQCDVFFSVVNTSITHTEAVKSAVRSGARGIIMTQFREKLMISGGIDANFKEIAPKCKKVAKLLEGKKKIELKTILGTDLTFSAEGRRGNALTGVVKKGEFSTVPTIEANVSPLEGTANGIIIADASIPYLNIGVLDEPVKFEVKDGMIKSIEGGVQAEIFKLALEEKKDPLVYNIAELGIGLNPHCSFIGFMLEDEGVYGSAHIGIGTNITLGGKIKTACHYDVIMKSATVIVDGKKIIENGKVLV